MDTCIQIRSGRTSNLVVKGGGGAVGTVAGVGPPVRANGL